jgi:hypothetical protein
MARERLEVRFLQRRVRLRRQQVTGPWGPSRPVSTVRVFTVRVFCRRVCAYPAS